MYDAIVIGARCAGSPTAMLLARKGYRVLLLDKAGFPSDTLSTHYIHQPAIASLKKWGLLDRVRASNCPPITEQRFDVGPFALTGAPPPVDGVAEAYAPRRKYLDNILVDAAVEAGAELREHFTVQELLTDGEQITGIKGHTLNGPIITEQARIVIGADGLRSFVARSVDAPIYRARPTFTCAFYSYWNDVPVTAAELYPRPNRMIIVAPTNDKQTLAIVYWPHSDFQRVSADIETNFMEALELVPGLAERVRSGTRAERFRGTADLLNQYRQSYGSGWALVGDAGYHKDPILALGITDAFLDVELLVESLDDGFSGRQSLETALAVYQNTRDMRSEQGFETTCQLATLAPPPPEMQQLFAALINNPEQISRFFGTFVGVVPASEFFSPENIANIMMHAQPQPARI